MVRANKKIKGKTVRYSLLLRHSCGNYTKETTDKLPLQAPTKENNPCPTNDSCPISHSDLLANTSRFLLPRCRCSKVHSQESRAFLITIDQSLSAALKQLR